VEASSTPPTTKVTARMRIGVGIPATLERASTLNCGSPTMNGAEPE
jgi:hypothetical protein